MNDLGPLGKMLIIVGIFLIGIGVFILVIGKVPYLGRLPGDIYIKKNNFAFYFPLVTCIVISVLLTLILNLFFRR